VSSPKIRMMFFPRERFPTSRVRLTILFNRELVGRGHAIDLCMQAQDESVRVGRHEFGGRSVWVGATDPGSTVYHKARKHALGIWHDLRWLWRAKADRYDCILVSDKYFLACVALVLARLRGLSLFFWMTFPLHEANVALGRQRLTSYPFLSRLRGHISGLALRFVIIPFSDQLFVQSETMRENFCRQGADPDRVTPVVTGFDPSDITPVDGRIDSSQRGPWTIAYLGTLARERRLDVLIDMLSDLRRRGLTARLLLVGDGDTLGDRLYLEELAQTLGVQDQLEITGFLPRPDALARLRDADVCISPFYPSPILDVASPTKLVEYLALGLPVVANSHPDQSFVLRECRAGVCVPWGARYFARAVHWLSKRSDTQLAAMGARGRRWVEQHRSYHGIADDFERACLQALALRTGDS